MVLESPSQPGHSVHVCAQYVPPSTSASGHGANLAAQNNRKGGDSGIQHLTKQRKMFKNRSRPIKGMCQLYERKKRSRVEEKAL